MHIGPARSSKHGRKQAVTADPHHRPMSSHRRRLDVGRRAAAAELSNIGAELRTAREQAGLSQRAVAVSLGWRREKISRIENARLRTAALHDLMAHSAALGLTMRVKVYPDGPPLRDIAQLSVSQRLLSGSRTHGACGWRFRSCCRATGGPLISGLLLTASRSPLRSSPRFGMYRRRFEQHT